MRFVTRDTRVPAGTVAHGVFRDGQPKVTLALGAHVAAPVADMTPEHALRLAVELADEAQKALVLTVNPAGSA